MLCDCPTLRPKKELGDSDRDISGLLAGRYYRSEAKGSGTTPHCIMEKANRIKQQSSLLGWREGERRLPFKRGTDFRLAYPFPGKPAARSCLLQSSC